VSTAQEEIAQGWQRTDRLGIAVAALRGLQQALIPIVLVTIGSGGFGGGIFVIVPILLVILGTGVGAAWLRWRRLRYRVGESDIQVEQGLISRQARSVPYERIQDVSLEQKPIPRLLGLVEVRFETGAGGKDELQLAYVSMEEGERLREVVRDQREGAAVVAGDPDRDRAAIAEPKGELLFAMGPDRLLTYGLFSFSLVVIAVLAGAAQQFDVFLTFDPRDFSEWENRLAGPGAWLAGLGWASRIVGGVILFLALIVLGMVTGVVRTFLRDWDFRLEKTPKGFRRRRGLLTKTDVVMPAHRVQAVTVGTGLMRKFWGWHGLSFISLAQDARSANHDVAPFAKMEEIAPIVKEAGFALPAEATDWRRPSPKYRTDKALLGAVPLVVLGLVTFLFEPVVWLGPIILALAAFEVAQQYYLWRHERHAVDPRQVLSRRGWLVPRLQIADKVKLHSVSITQGPLAKKRGYANLTFGLAGGTLSFHGIPLVEAEAMRGLVLDSIAAVDFANLPR
jgi:putative membrane protein